MGKGKGKGPGPGTCCSADYMSQTRDGNGLGPPMGWVGSDFLWNAMGWVQTSKYKNSCMIFNVRRSALHGLWDRNSVRLSVCLSVILVDCVHMVRPTIISSPYGSPIILVSGDITFIPKFEGGHPERGR